MRGRKLRTFGGELGPITLQQPWWLISKGLKLKDGGGIEFERRNVYSVVRMSMFVVPSHPPIHRLWWVNESIVGKESQGKT